MVWASDHAHLALTVGFGVGQLGAAPRSGRSSFVAYDWSAGFAGGPYNFLIYDATDEIAFLHQLHKRPNVSGTGLGEECAGKVRRLLSHYYVYTC